jgi:hypothetical protein
MITPTIIGAATLHTRSIRLQGRISLQHTPIKVVSMCTHFDTTLHPPMHRDRKHQLHFFDGKVAVFDSSLCFELFPMCPKRFYTNLPRKIPIHIRLHQILDACVSWIVVLSLGLSSVSSFCSHAWDGYDHHQECW